MQMVPINCCNVDLASVLLLDAFPDGDDSSARGTPSRKKENQPWLIGCTSAQLCCVIEVAILEKGYPGARRELGFLILVGSHHVGHAAHNQYSREHHNYQIL
jgi:hypothetical protein